MSKERIKEISVFVDESGSYDADVSSSPYYIVCLVLHDQAADMICTLEHIKVRIEAGVGLNNSEKMFFGNARLFMRNVYRQFDFKKL